MNVMDSDANANSGNTPDNFADEVWTYRGYQLKSSEFNTAMIHLFRAEISRANTWRQRLDATTNWAVLTTGASLSFTFGETSAHHSVIILTTLLVTVFLMIEARRYRYYELWSLRIRMLEVKFFAAMLEPGSTPADTDWARRLSDSLLYPRFPISLWEAVGRRLRLNYLWLYLLLGLVWFMKVWLYPDGANTFEEFLVRASIGAVPGWIVLTVGFVLNGALFLIGLTTRNLHEATGEVLPYKSNIRNRFENRD